MAKSDESSLDQFFDRMSEHAADLPFMAEKRAYVLDKNKNLVPATMVEHMRFMCKCDMHVPGFERIVAKDKIGSAEVSTVFLGHMKSALFETMIFSGDSTQQYRWKTWKEAEEGHKGVCQIVRAGG